MYSTLIAALTAINLQS